MKIEFIWNNTRYFCHLNQGIDLSIAYKESIDQVNCFYAPLFNAQAVKMGDFIGSVKDGGPVNFHNTMINIHGSGTHTECVGHIRQDRESVNTVFKQYFGVAHLLSVYPTKQENGDRQITEDSLSILWNDIPKLDFLIIRSLPNSEDKKQMHYSGTNPVYLTESAIHFIKEKGIKHLLVDLPSVDKEVDGGALLAHNAFWELERAMDCTITELIYIPDYLKDGNYLINLQMASIELDASPSRPVLFHMYE